MQQQQQLLLLPPQSQLNCQHTGACSCAAGSSRPQVLGADQLEGSQLPWKQPALPLQEERVALQERAVPLRVRELITEITSSLASGDRSVERADIVDSHQLEDSAGRALVSATASTGPVRRYSAMDKGTFSTLADHQKSHGANGSASFFVIMNALTGATTHCNLDQLEELERNGNRVYLVDGLVYLHFPTGLQGWFRSMQDKLAKWSEGFTSFQLQKCLIPSMRVLARYIVQKVEGGAVTPAPNVTAATIAAASANDLLQLKGLRDQPLLAMPIIDTIPHAPAAGAYAFEKGPHAGTNEAIHPKARDMLATAVEFGQQLDPRFVLLRPGAYTSPYVQKFLLENLPTGFTSTDHQSL